MKLLHILLAGLCTCASAAHAGVVQLDLGSVYNIDGVANVGDVSQSPLDQPNAGGNFVFLTQSLAANLAGTNGNGLADSGLYAGNDYHPAIQLGYGLNPDGNNVLQFAGTGPVSLALDAGYYREIHVAAMTGGGNSLLNLVFHYADGDEIGGTAVVNDWYNDLAPNTDTYYLADALDRVSSDQAVYENADDPALFGHRFVVDPTRRLLGIDFVAYGTSTFEPRMNIFGAAAVTADAEVPEPGTLALLMIGVAGLASRKRKAV